MGERLITPDDPEFDGVELTAEQIYADKVSDAAEWMRGATWTWATWTAERAAQLHSPSWDHDHCHFCFTRFSEYDSEMRDGWTNQSFPAALPEDETTPGYYWVCADCFQNLRDPFGWLVEAPVSSTACASVRE